ncbi:DUF378 domain-containing protein [Halobacterium zhouii]|uniref:DUF378 domain-containing protein n=1 Tax=Halobacterium zhouii TaxID=2902624 RepID=UPI001E5B2A22|nr:DUF378 domain-containing protein [Halobacterium zhouii]
MNLIDWTALALVVVGALNWGLVGIGYFVDAAANWNLVNIVFGSIPELEFAVYLLVGLAGVYGVYFASKVAGVETSDSGMDVGERTTPK